MSRHRSHNSQPILEYLPARFCCIKYDDESWGLDGWMLRETIVLILKTYDSRAHISVHTADTQHTKNDKCFGVFSRVESCPLAVCNMIHGGKDQHFVGIQLTSLLCISQALLHWDSDCADPQPYPPGGERGRGNRRGRGARREGLKIKFVRKHSSGNKKDQQEHTAASECARKPK